MPQAIYMAVVLLALTITPVGAAVVDPPTQIQYVFPATATAAVLATAATVAVVVTLRPVKEKVLLLLTMLLL